MKEHKLKKGTPLKCVCELAFQLKKGEVYHFDRYSPATKNIIHLKEFDGLIGFHINSFEEV